MISEIEHKLTTSKRFTGKALSGLLLVFISFYVSQVQALTDTYTASTTWTAPAGVTSVTVEVWGGGGAGGGNPTNSDGGGGGGGGGYSKSTLTVVPGTGYTVVVGAGGTGVVGDDGNGGGQSYFINAATVRANGGAGGGVATNVGGTGGAGGALGVGTTRFSGGTGGVGLNNNTGQGGPGGSSAGTAANGTNGPTPWSTGTQSTAQSPPAGGGIGGDGNTNADGYSPASGNGGGGGGSGDRSGPGGDRAGGNGAGGKVAITYTLPTLVTSINCVGGCTSNAASVSWLVTFSTSVTGGSSSNFTLVNSALGGTPAITSVTGSGATRTVTASTGSGSGTLGLNMANSTGVSPAVTGLPFTGQVYTVDRTVPVASSIVRADPTPTALASVSWTVSFSETVTGVDTGDFALVQAGGLSGALITAVTPVSGTIYTVSASTGTGNGTLGLNLVDNDSIIDVASNRLGGTGAGNGNFSGQIYSVVLPASVTANPTLCVNDASIGVASGNWTGLTNVGTQNNVYAQASVANSDITNYLKCTGYGFSIPAGATINGITVGPWLNSSYTMLDNAMQLVKGGAIQATNLATSATITNGGGAFAASPTQFIYGSSSNLWGNTWTVANINSANFGAAFAAQRGGFSSTQQAGVDAMPITIDYTLPAFPTVVSINLASLDPTTPATAVSWTITFSASVTGVDTADFALVQAGGVSGASITSVTGSGSTWTVAANTGSGNGTLGLNLVDNDSIIDSGGSQLGGTGVGNGDFTGQVYTIAAPLTCITDNFSTGTLDTSLWDVKTIQGPYLPQVVNAGGGDYRLRLTDTNNNEATFAQLKRIFPAAGNKVVLEIDYFAYGGSGADGIAIAFSDATIASTTGGFGGSLGYAQNGSIAGFGGGWLGVGLDEYGNFSNPTESRNGYPSGWVAPAPANVAAGFYKTNVSVRGSGSVAAGGYSLLANTGILATPVAPASGAAGATPYRYRITLDHSSGVYAYVTVERDTTGTGASYTTVIPKFDAKGTSSGQAAVPANWLLSFTGSTGGATNNHEFKQVKVCANTIIGGGPHHLEIQHASGTGLTCTPSTLTIKACADAACTTAYTAGVTGTLSKTGSPTVNWSGSNSFSIPAGSSTVTKNVQVTTPGSVVFGAVGTPAAASATTCNFGTPGCTFTAADTGLLLSAPNHLAETAAVLTVQAVKKADDSLMCVPAFANTAKTVNLKCAYSNPATGTLPVRVGGAALNATANPATACDASGANVSLNFDATGTATPALQYADVGQMNLIASFTGTAGSLDAGLSMTGSTSFIAAPASFAFSGITAGPIKAGNPFSVTVSALNSAGAVTPNYGKESAPGPAGVTLTSNLVTPNPVTYPAAANPTPGNNVITGTEFGAGGMLADANGVATVNNLSWDEVGSIELLAKLTNPNGYLGTAGTPTRDALNNILTTSGTSATIGAFIPDHFDTAVVPTATVPMPCPTGLTCPASYDGFVYSGQAFSLQVTARNLAGATTTNYSSVYGLANNVSMSVWDALGSVVTPTGAGSLANSTLASTAFISGVGLTTSQTYTFASSPVTSPTAPTDIFLRAVDTTNASVTSLRAIPATSIEGGVKVVSGKLAISHAHGSELLPLPLTISVQYWDNTDWVTSTTDDITQFDTNLSTSGGNIVTNILAGLGGGLSVATPAVVTVTGGIKVDAFTLNAPLSPGSADISLNAPAYLLAGSNGAGINPSEAARVTFGIFKGPNNIIYIREVY